MNSVLHREVGSLEPLTFWKEIHAGMGGRRKQRGELFPAFCIEWYMEVLERISKYMLSVLKPGSGAGVTWLKASGPLGHCLFSNRKVFTWSLLQSEDDTQFYPG